jgi:hypothetical protein
LSAAKNDTSKDYNLKEQSKNIQGYPQLAKETRQCDGAEYEIK